MINVLSSISHELRTPLNGIIARLECAIDDRKVDAKAKAKFLVPSFNCSRLLLDFINDLVDYIACLINLLYLFIECVSSNSNYLHLRILLILYALFDPPCCLIAIHDRHVTVHEYNRIASLTGFTTLWLLQFLFLSFRSLLSHSLQNLRLDLSCWVLFVGHKCWSHHHQQQESWGKSKCYSTRPWSPLLVSWALLWMILTCVSCQEISLPGKRKYQIPRMVTPFSEKIYQQCRTKKLSHAAASILHLSHEDRIHHLSKWQHFATLSADPIQLMLCLPFPALVWTFCHRNPQTRRHRRNKRIR